MEHNLEAISLALSIQSIGNVLIVLFLWFTPTIRALTKEEKTSSDYLLLGVFISFTSKFLDQSFWHYAWTCVFCYDPNSDSIIKFGVIPNIFFRQVLTILAAYCHVVGAAKAKNKKSLIFVVNILNLLLIVLGIVFVIVVNSK